MLSIELANLDRNLFCIESILIQPAWDTRAKKAMDALQCFHPLNWDQNCNVCVQCVVMLIVLFLYKWEELAVYASASVAAATPKQGDGEGYHLLKPSMFSRSPAETALLNAQEHAAGRSHSTVRLESCIKLHA